MPELPEVHTTVSGLDETIRGLAICDVWTNYISDFHAGKDNIKNPLFFRQFKKKVVGATIVSVTRRAKNILIHLSSGSTILIHMKMIGHILYGHYTFNKTNTKDPWSPLEDGPLKDPFNRFIRLVFTMSNGMHVVLSDMRRFAKVTLLSTEHHLSTSHLDYIGPEPLDSAFTFSVFKNQLSKKPQGRIKTILMDQSIIAGVGNIYSDEALWRAGVHPEERIRYLSPVALKKIYTATCEVLRKGIAFGGDSMSDYRNIQGERGAFQGQHQAYRRTGKKCNKKGCRGIITRKVVGGRSAHFCSVHQKLSRDI